MSDLTFSDKNLLYVLKEQWFMTVHRKVERTVGIPNIARAMDRKCRLKLLYTVIFRKVSARIQQIFDIGLG